MFKQKITFIHLLFGTFILTALFHTSMVYAADINAMTMINNIANAVPNLIRLVTAIAYVLGMYLTIKGIIELKHFGESRTMVSREHGLSGPITYLIIGTLLIFIPTSVDVGLSTFWSNPCPFCYIHEQGRWNEFLNNCFLIMQLIGIIAFVRGLVIISHLGGGHSQPGVFGKGLTHIIGGLFCINAYQLIQVVLITIGISFQ